MEGRSGINNRIAPQQGLSPNFAIGKGQAHIGTEKANIAA